MFRHLDEVHLDEDLAEDGQGGVHIVPACLKSLPVQARRDAEPGIIRFILEEAIKMIPAGFSPWAQAQIELCIRAHDIRMNCANQRTYRVGIDAKLTAGHRPSFLSVHALRCIYFKHTATVEKR